MCRCHFITYSRTQFKRHVKPNCQSMLGCLTFAVGMSLETVFLNLKKLNQTTVDSGEQRKLDQETWLCRTHMVEKEIKSRHI